ncbi:hypothetical protein HNQ94_002554 [Salirhabdus euzebyi]|uniref:Uncharacterized protein n=1 Tax=Salirhabdus euzebyi TaxID=394506 RepID=A0A841Q6X6_9BACI|nr:hypothetical protein [Salirhabdus euzebyi]MBB6454103.1 hypothetical protein [Salirhabdus euzebyi]
MDRRRTDANNPDPHFDGEREGIYADNMGKQMGVSMDGDPKKQTNQNPEDAMVKKDPEMLKLNELIEGRDSSKKHN